MQPWLRRIRAVHSAVMTHLQALTRRALALVALAALVSHGVAARAETVQPFFLCEREEAFELARAYETSQQAVMDTMVRLLVPENIVADIVGHKKNTMTYGLYSGGVSLAVKRDALDKLAY